MDEKKRVYDSEIMDLHSLGLIIGDVPNPDLDKRDRFSQLMLKPNPEIEGTVKRIIAHLEEE